MPEHLERGPVHSETGRVMKAPVEGTAGTYPVVKFALSVNRQYPAKGEGWDKGVSEWIDVTVFNANARAVALTLYKGGYASVEGWPKDRQGDSRVFHDFTAQRVWRVTDEFHDTTKPAADDPDDF